jgi:hypothetical protein
VTQALNYITEKTARELMALLERDRQRRNASSKPAPDDDHIQAPEVYVALTPEAGISALASGAETGTGTDASIEYDRPGYADCAIFRVIHDSLDRPQLIEQTAIADKRVYNFSGTAIGGNELRLIVRDKFGNWFAQSAAQYYVRVTSTVLVDGLYYPAALYSWSPATDTETTVASVLALPCGPSHGYWPPVLNFSYPARYLGQNGALGVYEIEVQNRYYATVFIQDDFDDNSRFGYLAFNASEYRLVGGLTREDRNALASYSLIPPEFDGSGNIVSGRNTYFWLQGQQDTGSVADPAPAFAIGGMGTTPDHIGAWATVSGLLFKGGLYISGTLAVATGDIANDAVTYAKIQNVSATDKILGRVTAGAGDIEEVTFTDQAQQLCDDTSFGAMLTTLGGTTVGQAIFTLANPSAITFIRINADNTVSALSAAAFLSAIGGGAGDVTAASTFGTDNVLIRSDGTGKGVQGSLVAVNDLGNISTPGTIEAEDGFLLHTGGSDDLLVVTSNTGSAAAILTINTGDASRTLTISGDTTLSGTHTGTSTGTNTGDEAIIILRDEKAQNTDGGTFTSGSWQTRTLNTEVSDASGLCSLASNQFTLTAGTYMLISRAPAVTVNYHVLRLRNVTDGTTIEEGNSAYARPDPNGDQSDAWLFCKFTVAASKALEIQHLCTTTAATFGFGLKGNLTGEVFTEVYLRKVA